MADEYMEEDFESNEEDFNDDDDSYASEDEDALKFSDENEDENNIHKAENSLTELNRRKNEDAISDHLINDDEHYYDDDDDNDGEEEGKDPGDLIRPEIRLARLKKENIDHDFRSGQINRIKCLALCKILHGKNHWKVAEAHVELANVYLKGKHYPLQTLKHASLARNILLNSESNENSSMQYLLQNLYYVMGQANFQLNKYKSSENCLQKAKLVADNSKNATSKFYTLKVTILSSLASTLSKLGHFGQATECIEEGIEMINKMAGDNRSLHIKLCKQMVNLELLNGKYANFMNAEEYLATALKLLSDMEEGGNSTEVAEFHILQSRIESQKEIPDYSKIEMCLQDGLEIYRTLENVDKIFSVQQMFCKVLMQQEKYAEAKSMLEKCIDECELKKGNMSLLCAELNELMGSLLFSQSKLSAALNYFLKAKEIYQGKRKQVKKQEKIAKIIDMIRKSSKDEKVKTSADKLKERPRFQ